MTTTRTRSRMRIGALIAGAALTAAAMAGCTTTTPKPTPTPRPSASATAKAPGITDVTHAPGSGEGLVGALADSKVTTCELRGSAWKVAGTVKNPTDAKADYRIYVSLLDSAGGTRALQEVDVDADAGATEDWSADVKTAEKGLSCVLRVERYASQ